MILVWRKAYDVDWRSQSRVSVVTISGESNQSVSLLGVLLMLNYIKRNWI